MNKDYYSILGVSRTASADEIKKAYRSLSKKYHPDLQQGKTDAEKKEAEEKFKDINEAYSVLEDPNKKSHYDQFGTAENGPGGFGAGGFDPMEFFRNHFRGSFGDFGFGFGPFGSFSSGGSNPNAPKNGGSVKTSASISFEESLFGATKEIKIRFSDTCDECNGTGAKNGDVKTCEHCGGSGMVSQQIGPFSFQSTTCPVCGGTGNIPVHVCDKCHGHRTTMVEKTVKINIPAGVDSGETLRIPGRGRRGLNGGSDGDLYIVINVESNELFERDGSMLYTRIHVPSCSVIPGATVDVATPYGKKTIKIPDKQSADGSYHVKLPGDGIHRMRRGQTIKGDLIVFIVPEIPVKLNKKQLELLELFRKSLSASNSPMVEASRKSISDFEKRISGFKK